MILNAHCQRRVIAQDVWRLTSNLRKARAFGCVRQFNTDWRTVLKSQTGIVSGLDLGRCFIVVPDVSWDLHRVAYFTGYHYTPPHPGRGTRATTFSRRPFAPELCRHHASNHGPRCDLRQTAPAVGPAAVTITRGEQSSPDGAKRNPGTTKKLECVPGFRFAPSGLHLLQNSGADRAAGMLLFVCPPPLAGEVASEACR